MSSNSNKLSCASLRRSTLRPTALSLMALLGVGCGASEDDDADPAGLVTDVPCDPTVDGGSDEGEPDGGGEVDGGTAPDGGTDPGDEGPSEPGAPYFASVTANGTGCPAGTWETKLADDGETYTTRFKAYEATLTDGAHTSFKDCNLTFRIQAPEGLSFALTDFSYYGHVKLDEGVRGFATVNSYFQGNPAASADRDKRIDFTGPVDEPLVVHSKREGAGLLWSPCGVERNLNVVTRIGLNKGEGVTGGGTITAEGLGNPEDLALSFRLAWRKCADGSPVEPPDSKPDTAPDTSKPDAGKPDATEPDTTPDPADEDNAGPAGDVDAGASAPSRPRRPRLPWGR